MSSICWSPKGDTIAVDQDILEVETEKAVIPVPSTVAGTIEKIHVSKGDTIPIGGVILTVSSDGAANGGRTRQRGCPGRSQARSAGAGSQSFGLRQWSACYNSVNLQQHSHGHTPTSSVVRFRR